MFSAISSCMVNIYSHLIIPNYYGSDLNSHAKKIKEFVSEGGTLIGYRNTTKWLDKNEFIDLEFINQNLTAVGISFEDKDKFTGAQYSQCQPTHRKHAKQSNQALFEDHRAHEENKECIHLNQASETSPARAISNAIEPEPQHVN